MKITVDLLLLFLFSFVVALGILFGNGDSTTNILLLFRFSVIYLHNLQKK